MSSLCSPVCSRSCFSVIAAELTLVCCSALSIFRRHRKTHQTEGKHAASAKLVANSASQSDQADANSLTSFVLPLDLACYNHQVSLSLANLELYAVPPEALCHTIFASLRVLDLHQNNLPDLPPEVGNLVTLTALDVSRNRLKALPAEVGRLVCLEELNALSNHLLPHERSLPLPELASLPQLRLLDLRFNGKLKGRAAQVLAEQLSARVVVRITIPDEHRSEQAETKVKLSAGDRDPLELRSQLEPHSTPQLRKRLANDFGVLTHPDEVGREELMLRLLACYAAEAPRAVRKLKGTPVSARLQEELLKELRAIVWPSEVVRERQTVRANGYMTLQKPRTTFSKEDGSKAKLAAAKLQKHGRVWALAAEALAEVDASFFEVYTAIAVTKGFVGSPHIDTENLGPFYGLALGDFSNGGAICVECSAREVAEVDTRGRLGKIDGRFPHWVMPYMGERYSIIYYQTEGVVTPQTVAVFN